MRQIWYCKNLHTKHVGFGDLQNLPTLAPTQKIDLLGYSYTQEEILQNKDLLVAFQKGWLQLSKVIDGGAPIVVSVISDLNASVTSVGGSSGDILINSSGVLAGTVNSTRLRVSAASALTLDNGSGGAGGLTVTGAMSVGSVGNLSLTVSGSVVSNYHTNASSNWELGQNAPGLSLNSTGCVRWTPAISAWYNSAADVRLLRTAASTLTLDNGSSGAAHLSITGNLASGGILTIPGNDVSSGLRFSNDANTGFYTSSTSIYVLTGNVKVARFTSGVVDLGTGGIGWSSGSPGAVVMDTMLRRTAANTLTLDNNSCGAANLVVTANVLASTLKLTGLSTYASNAAAISGGLAVDTVYKTGTGELRIVV